MTFPSAFKDQMANLLGSDSSSFFNALAEEPPVSIRINPAKVESLPNTCEPVKWSAIACYLDRRPLFTADPLLHAGAYYVQEASSMFTGYLFKKLMNTDQPMLALDLCAAPGGKSTHLASLLPKNGLLVANEVIKSRAEILAENVIKWGTGNVVVTNNDPKAFQYYGGMFDLVVVDAPCSGEGMFRKDATAVEEWSPEHVQHCAARQQRIMHDVWPAVKVGGFIIYSTCTYNEQENEESITCFCKAQPDAQLHLPEIENEIPVTKTEAGYRFYPHKTKGEGFFISVIQKTENTDIFSFTKTRKAKKKQTIGQLPKALAAKAESFLKPDRQRVFTVKNDYIIAYDADFQDWMTLLAKKLKVVYAGVRMGSMKRDKFIPDHALALSTHLDPSSFPKIDLQYENAVKYLAKEAFDIPADTPNGIVLLSYEGLGLGFIKNLGNRFNNNYPKEWRIRKRIDEVLERKFTLTGK